ncbi:MAG: ATP-binding cassette domain-containing protein [bacterium]|nr:ATP-binding cassette domain-containing protein [bacterium]
MDPLLEVNNIEVIYHNVILVLKGMSIRAQEGKIVTILGNNGAGKTTTLKAISGLLKSESFFSHIHALIVHGSKGRPRAK